MGTEEKFIDKLKKVPGIVEVSEVNGVYDIVVKISSQTLDNLKDTMTRQIRTIDDQIDDDANRNRIERKAIDIKYQ